MSAESDHEREFRRELARLRDELHAVRGAQVTRRDSRPTDSAPEK